MIVDTHMHIWRYPEHFDKDVMLLNLPPRRRNMPDEWYKKVWDSPIERYFELAAGIVDKAVIQGINMPKSLGITVPSDYIVEAVKRYPDKLAWCCAVNPTERDAAKEVERCVKELGAVGVGELGCGYQYFYADDERCLPVYKKAQELGVPVFIHAGPSQSRRHRLIYDDVSRVDEVAINFPDLKIVIAHMGYYRYEEALHIVQKHDNVFADVSWLPAIAGLDRTVLPRYLPQVQFPWYHWLYPLLYYFSATFGLTDKLLWGTDWSGASPKPCYQALINVNEHLRKFNLPEIPVESIHNILHENWKKVFPNL